MSSRRNKSVPFNRITLMSILCGLCIILATVSQSFAQEPAPGDEAESTTEELVRQVFTPRLDERRKALQKLVAAKDLSAVPGLISALRFIANNNEIVAALEKLTGAGIGDEWHDWMLWQEAHPEIKPFEGFDGFKADLMARIDDNFRIFLRRGIEHEIRLEEIAWGGVKKDGIPALNNPEPIRPEDAEYLRDDELVFGVEINGDARAYPLRILDWHEMFNDVIGGKHVALAYCTLCGSGILYETNIEGREKPLIFGSSGFLYRSNKLMYDTATHSLWNQFTGRPVVGPLTGSGIELKVLPVAITTWKKWYKSRPHSVVLSLDTGHYRDYTPGLPYGTYFASEDLMFPAVVRDQRLKAKDYVYAVRTGKHEKAWPLNAFAGGKVLNDAIEDLSVVLIGDAESHTVRAYERKGKIFEASANDDTNLIADGVTWKIEEDALINEDGEKLARLPGHIAFWFAWSGYKPDAAFAETKQ